MKRFVNNKRYDTKKAVKVCSHSIGDSNDNVTQTVYLTHNKEYFLHITGGAYTDYENGEIKNFEGPKKKDEDLLKKWLLAHQDGDNVVETIEAIYGAEIKDA